MELRSLILETHREEVVAEARRVLAAVEAELVDCGVPDDAATAFRESNQLRSLLRETLALAGALDFADGIRKVANARADEFRAVEEAIAALPEAARPEALRSAAAVAEVRRAWLEHELSTVNKSGPVAGFRYATIHVIGEALAALGAVDSPRSASQLARRELMRTLFNLSGDALKVVEKRAKEDALKVEAKNAVEVILPPSGSAQPVEVLDPVNKLKIRYLTMLDAFRKAARAQLPTPGK